MVRVWVAGKTMWSP